MVMRANGEHICTQLTITYRQNKTNSVSLLNKHAICLRFAPTNQGTSPDAEIRSSAFAGADTYARTREMEAGKITTTDRVSYRPVSRCVSLNRQ